MTRRRSHDRPALRDVVTEAIILAHQEDVSPLVGCLTAEGFVVTVLRREYSEEEAGFSRNSRTFLSHRDAWLRAAGRDGYTLICEADFVPCRGLGGFEAFWPTENPFAWGYLYQGSPRVFAILGSGRHLRGHTAPLVSYVVNKDVASLMLKFFEYERSRQDFRSYFTFDAHLQWYVMGLGAEAFLPKYHYGEHGGLPNAEHARLGRLLRRGEHHADNLMSPLHFLPPYANGNYVSFLLVRLGAHLKGFGRLATGKWISRTNMYSSSYCGIVRMYLLGVSRLLSMPL